MLRAEAPLLRGKDSDNHRRINKQLERREKQMRAEGRRADSERASSSVLLQHRVAACRVSTCALSLHLSEAERAGAAAQEQRSSLPLWSATAPVTVAVVARECVPSMMGGSGC